MNLDRVAHTKPADVIRKDSRSVIEARVWGVGMGAKYGAQVPRVFGVGAHWTAPEGHLVTPLNLNDPF